MKTETFDVKSKGQVVGQATVEIPESYAEAEARYGAQGLAALQYGIRVKEANQVRQAAVGGPKSVPAMIARKLKDNPEAMAKVMKLLGLE